jgi:hypothetical protein
VENLDLATLAARVKNSFGAVWVDLFAGAVFVHFRHSTTLRKTLILLALAKNAARVFSEISGNRWKSFFGLFVPLNSKHT